MKIKQLVATTGVIAIAAAMTMVQPAKAQTDVTFTIASGSLSITEPTGNATLTVTNDLTGMSAAGNLGSTSVVDQRNVLSGSWSASASNSTAFTNGTDTIPLADVNIEVLATDITVVSGSSVSTVAPTVGGVDGTGGVILTNTISVNLELTSNNQVDYDPTVTVTIAPGTSTGTYTGTITQTVA